MRLTINTKELRERLALLANVTGAKSGPLANVARINADGFGGLEFLHVTPEGSVKTTCYECSIEEGGSCAISLTELNKIVGRLGNKDAKLTDNQQYILIEAGDAKGRVAKIDPSTLCPEHDKLEGARLSFLAEDLHRWLTIAGRAASTDKGRPQLAGVTMRNQMGKLSIFGTDGRALHVVWIGNEIAPFRQSPQGHDEGAMIPSESVECVRSTIAKYGGRCDVVIGKSAATFTIAETSVRVPLMEVSVPGIEQLLDPGIAEWEIDCKREDLLEAVRAVEPVSDTDPRKMKIRMRSDSLIVEAVTKGQEVGFYQTVEARCVNDHVLTVNGTLFLRMIESTQSEELHITINAGYALHLTSNNFQGVLMLMRPGAN